MENMPDKTKKNRNSTTKKERYSITMIKREELAIRKLTPKECWNLMDFNEGAYEKAKWQEKKYTLECTDRVQAAVRKVFEKENISDPVDVHVSLLYLTKSQFINEKEQAKRIVQVGQSRFLLLKEERTALTALSYGDRKTYIRIQWQENISLSEKTNTWLSLFFAKLVLQSPCLLFVTSTKEVDITVPIFAGTVFGVFTVSCPKIEVSAVQERTSQTALYKQAGNAIVVNCLVAVFGQMFSSAKLQNLYLVYKQYMQTADITKKGKRK